jgi:AcrR family transcriptional regulator
MQKVQGENFTLGTVMLEQPVRIDTRARILEVAEMAGLAKGFAATSIEEIIAAVGITKSGFFYHFRDKSALAKGLLLRYLEHDRQVLNDIFARGDELNDDPLHGFLVGLKLFAEMLGNLPEAHPGCLAASFCYQDQLFNREIAKLNADGMLAWRNRFRERFDLIAMRYPPRNAVDFDALADMAATLVEGGLILGRVFKDVTILPRQILLYRDFVRSIFLPG